MLRPKISATALRRPSEPILPSPLNQTAAVSCRLERERQLVEALLRCAQKSPTLVLPGRAPASVPILDGEARDATEFPDVARDEDRAVRERGSGDQDVVGADRLPDRFEIRANPGGGPGFLGSKGKEADRRHRLLELCPPLGSFGRFGDSSLDLEENDR